MDNKTSDVDNLVNILESQLDSVQINSCLRDVKWPATRKCQYCGQGITAPVHRNMLDKLLLIRRKYQCNSCGHTKVKR